MKILKSALEIIDSNMSELDNKGLYTFCNSNVIDFDYNDRDNSLYTLLSFLMKLFDDDPDALVDELIASGYNRWEGLPEFNRLGASGTFPTSWLNYVYFNIARLDSLRIPIDVDRVFEKSDYLGGIYTLGITRECLVDKPFICCAFKLGYIDKSLWDKLYVGVFTDDSRYPNSSMHYAFGDSLSYQTRDNSRGIYYDTISNVVERIFKNNIDYDTNIATALPKEILDKYGLPIYKG